MPTINDLRQQAATIKNATQVGENTATRVGTTFETIADLLEGMGGVTNLSTIDIGSIDTLNMTGDMLVGTPNIYTLTKTIGANTFKVGTLFQFANNGRYDVAQVIVSQFIVDADGRIDTTSADQEVHIFYRLCKTMNGGSLPTPIGTWTTWTELGGSGGSGVTIDPYPTQNSGNAVSSGGVFERLQDVAPKVDISAIDDIDEYSDMLATKSPFYVVTKTLSGNVFRIGTLMEFANQGRYILYQILATDYVLNDDGTLDTTLSENGGLKLIWRMKQFSGNPPAGVTIGVWSTWSYLSGGGAQPDNEDIDLNADDQLQFANKAYDASAFSGLGRTYLRKNISGGKNILTQAMVNTANTIYHIQYDFDLNGQTITLPANCVLEFDGGSVKDSVGTGSLVLNNTYIKCDEPRVGILHCGISGTQVNSVVFPEWLVNSPSADFATALNTLISTSANGTEIKFTAANYKITPVVTLKSNISFTSENGARIYTDETALYTAMFFNTTGNHCSNITFRGLQLEQTATNYTVLSGSQVSRLIICCYDSDNIRIESCKFTFNGTNCVSVNGANCINTYIKDNAFVFKRATNPSSYDVSAVYVADHFHIIENNRFNGYSNNSADRVNGAIESHGVCGIVANNTINNAKVCINVVNNITPTSTDASGRQIFGNICSDVDNFVILWPMTDFGTMKNIIISDNIVTDVKISAITSNYATGLKSDVEGLFVHDNTFIGKSNAFDGNEVNPNLIDIFNLVAVKFYTPANVSARIERNVFKDWPCQIVGMGYYNSSAESTTKQQVVFKDNSLINCFNGSISHYYNAYFNLALCNVNKYGYLEFVDNVIDIPETATMPPIFGSFTAECDIVIKGTIFKACRTKMFYINANATTDIDLLAERSLPQIIPEGATNVRFLVGDYVWDRTKTSRCTKAGRNVSVTMSNASANLSYGVTFFRCDNTASLEVDDVFSSTAIGTSSALTGEKIACICNGKIYTDRWRTLGGYFEEGVTQYTPTLTFVTAEFGDASVGTGSSGPSNFAKGTLYYSLGGGRPMFKNTSGDWVDVFNHTYASYQGTFANRPNAATFGHFYFTTDADNRRLIVKNSTGADNWVDTDGFNAKYARKGTTAERPTPANNNQDKGLSYFDTTINKPIYWTGTGWVDATGAAV